MSFLTTLANLFVPQTRSTFVDFPSLHDQIDIVARRKQGRAWRAASVKDALGVPAIWGAVSLIADTVGSLSLEGFRQGSLLGDADRPRLIIRPNPLSTPRSFFRDSAFYLASRGESWWWIAARDSDGSALSLYPVPPWEIMVEENPRNRLRPIIRWADREMRNEDMRQITYMPNGLRGMGPLQACGAAISVAVESQDWASNFFASNVPSLIGETEQDMDEHEMAALKEQWLETEDANLPRFVTQGLKLRTLEFNPEQAQLTDTRQHSVGDSARIFNMPGSLIEYQMGGSSLTYQNQDGIWADFQRRCLSPHYLEPIEQEMSDLLTRATVARFNLKQLLRSDPKTRMEVHSIAIASGIYGPEVAASEEGYAPGSVDYAPVPLALPASIPLQLPMQSRSAAVRCGKCKKLLAESATPPYKMTCSRCKTVAESTADLRTFDGIDAVDGMKLAIHSLAQPPVVNVAPAEAPIVNIAPPEVEVNVHTDSFADAVREFKEMLTTPKEYGVVRNEEGRIVGLEKK